ncbi:MAG: alpha-isopropylmalate synthase regulatory domain-containing protein [Oscillospiraceae bacterium]|nr:alpha-isopropylmalate synthase regulatory domain-containing protein [Oscillospiraceae bacterium]
MEQTVRICDATIWLGEQTPGYSMSAKEKLETAKQLERLGVDVIEVGYLLPQSAEAIDEIARSMTDAIVSVMCRPNAKEIEAALAVVGKAAHGRVDIVAHPGEPLKKAVLAAVKKTAAEVTLLVAPENEAQLGQSAAEAALAGAQTICVCDVSGAYAPGEFERLIGLVREAAPAVAVSAMGYNDLGMASANVLAAVKAGAHEVKCSVLGVGERAGTAALEEVAAALDAREDYYGAKSNIRLRGVYRTCKFVATVLGYQIESNKPVIGDGAGMAGGGLLQPESFGIFRNNLVLGKFSSRTDFDARVTELGYILSDEKLAEGYDQFTALTARKKAVSDRDIEAIVEPLGPVVKDTFELVNFVINSGSMFPSTSTILLKKNGRETTKVEIGSGPVDAAFKAVDRVAKYEVSLENYALQSVTEGEDALGDAVVKVRYKDRLFTGRGLSTDVVEASIRAYVNALNKIAAAAGDDAEQQ